MEVSFSYQEIGSNHFVLELKKKLRMTQLCSFYTQLPKCQGGADTDVRIANIYSLTGQDKHHTYVPSCSSSKKEQPSDHHKFLQP